MFILGRVISDNVLTIHGALHYLKVSIARKHSFMSIMTDIKEYYILKWNFIKHVLEHLGLDWKTGLCSASPRSPTLS